MSNAANCSIVAIVAVVAMPNLNWATSTEMRSHD
jgi:hypothetical protein